MLSWYNNNINSNSRRPTMSTPSDTLASFCCWPLFFFIAGRFNSTGSSVIRFLDLYLLILFVRIEPDLPPPSRLASIETWTTRRRRRNKTKKGDVDKIEKSQRYNNTCGNKNTTLLVSPFLSLKFWLVCQVDVIFLLWYKASFCVCVSYSPYSVCSFDRELQRIFIGKSIEEYF